MIFISLGGQLEFLLMFNLSLGISFNDSDREDEYAVCVARFEGLT